MKHLKYISMLRNNRVRVFDQPSRNENMILKPVMRDGHNDIVSVAHDYLDQIVFIGWPHLTKAKVFAVSNRSQRIDVNGVQIADERTYDLHVKSIKEHLSGRMGVELEDYSVIVHVQTLMGVKYICGPEGRMTLNEIWSKIETVYPAQAVIKNISSHCEGFVQHKKVEDVFTVGSKIFFIGNPYFGNEGVVLDPMLIYSCGRLKISITVLPEPELQKARRIQSHLSEEYLNTSELAAHLGIMPNLVSRITGTIFVYAGTRRHQLPENAKKYSIALQLRFVKQNEEVQGYTKKAGNNWLFSRRCMELIDEYLSKFPMITQLLSNQNGRDVYFESDLFPTGVDPENNAENMQNWIKSHEYQKSDRVPCGTQTIEKKQPVKTVKLQVKPFLLLKPEINFSSVERPKRPFKLFDRVVVVRRTHQVPLRFKGTIISIHPITDPNPVRLENVKTVDNNYEIIFDHELPDGHGIYGIANGRVCKVPEANLVMIFQNNTNNTNGIPGAEDSEREVQVLKRGEPGKSDVEKKPARAGTNDNGNFWNPEKSDNKKAFMNMLNNANAPRQTPKKKIDLSAESSSQQKTTEDPVDETTNQLKFMLGISGTSKQSIEPPKLPQPPVNWKNDALSLNQVGSHPQVGLQNPPLMPFGPPQMRHPGPYQHYQQPHPSQKPLVFYTQQLPQFASQQQLPYVNDNFYSPTYLNQKGAFTPTQVIRCATKNMSKDSKSQKDDSAEPPTGSRSNDNIPQQTKTYYDKPRPKTQQHRQPPPKRRPKIAAKFDSNFE
ncbi:XRN1.2 family protein [Megaselia abdita]